MFSLKFVIEIRGEKTISIGLIVLVYRWSWELFSQCMSKHLFKYVCNWERLDDMIHFDHKYLFTFAVVTWTVCFRRKKLNAIYNTTTLAVTLSTRRSKFLTNFMFESYLFNDQRENTKFRILWFKRTLINQTEWKFLELSNDFCDCFVRLLHVFDSFVLKVSSFAVLTIVNDLLIFTLCVLFYYWLLCNEQI